MAIRCGVGHILFRGRHPTFQPEHDPIVVDKDLGPDLKFTFIDVIPGFVRQPNTYHPFSALVEATNIWLGKNMDWQVINCETVLLFFKTTDSGTQQLAPEDTCFPLDADAHNSLMGLRLWLKRREENEEPPEAAQVLKYVDFTPKLDDNDESTRFQKLDTVVKKANEAIRKGAVDGEIITIETLYFPATSTWKLEADDTIHLFPTRCISILRIFFEQGTGPFAGTIGIQDFLPRHLSGGSLWKKPEFEPFSEVIQRASAWLSENPQLDFKNAQCLEVKMKTMGRADSKVMSHSADRGDYIRIYRVSYAKPPVTPAVSSPNSTGESASCPPPAPIYLSSTIFTPADQEATVQEIKRKIHEWVEQATKDVMANSPDSAVHKPRLLSAETVEIFTKDFTEEEIRAETENTFKFNRIGTMNSFLFMAFRVYFDVGYFGRKQRSKSIASTVSHTNKHDASSCQMM